MKKQRRLGEVIKARRTAIDISQRELAHRVGVEGSHIAFIEAGRRRPSLALLFRLAQNLDIDQQELFLLAYPNAAAFIEPKDAPLAESREAVWRRFLATAPRYSVTAGELAILRKICLLGRISSPSAYRSILNSIRQAFETD
ncbi:MAG: helix-turn-helix transcriptional regulator [Candidatus Binatus sp.]|uniref:helix-turn-helix domain-containing protein n=1 Tax=Candidatus Binatus sp. TaxID=2811406 RepID=UPI00271703E4|nr:helix-turn-helix transcriptional regulator [Candidatus Binatus sp.]MDO8431895.1 helix-turn-helix transcriptional regulator [Candidatus Binatus sp.]